MNVSSYLYCREVPGSGWEEKAEGSTAAPTVSLWDLCTCPLLPLLGPQFLFTHLMQELDFTNVKASSTLA